MNNVLTHGVGAGCEKSETRYRGLKLFFFYPLIHLIDSEKSETRYRGLKPFEISSLTTRNPMVRKVRPVIGKLSGQDSTWAELFRKVFT